MLDSTQFSRDVLAALPVEMRSIRLAEMGVAASRELAETATLGEFQKRLYRLIEDELVGRLGYWLGRWEYDCEIEYWGGKSYMDPSVSDELLLRSEFPIGVQFNWGEFVFPPPKAPEIELDNRDE